MNWCLLKQIILLCFQYGIAALGNSSFCNDKHKAGVMIPIPAFYHYKARIKEFGLFEVIAYLIEFK